MFAPGPVGIKCFMCVLSLLCIYPIPNDMFVQWLIIATASARSISFCSYYYYGFTRLPPKLVYFYLLLTDWLKWDLLHYASLLARGHVFTLAYCTTLYKEQTQESDRGTWGQAIAKILGGPTSGSNNFLLLTFSSAAVSHSFQRVKSTRLAVAQHVRVHYWYLQSL